MCIPATRTRAILLFVLLIGLAGAGSLWAQERRFTMAVPDDVAETAFLKYLLPRFTLKHSVRITPVAAGTAADCVLTAEAAPDAIPAFEGGGRRYWLIMVSANPNVQKFADWLTSDVGRRTIDAYPGQDVAFSAPSEIEIEAEAPTIAGDAARGLVLSQGKCGRCHVVDDKNPLRGIGSTPSFFVLRALGDWYERFSTFYVRNPHPSFTQMPGITQPFPIDRPPPIYPIELTQGGLEHILAYVSALTPADLGAPIQAQ